MTVDVKVGAKDLYGFTMYYTYSGIMGKIWLLFSLVCLIAVGITWGDVPLTSSLGLIFLGSLFTVVQPLMLYIKCMQRVAKTPSYKEKFRYTFEKGGFQIAQGDQSMRVGWTELFQIVCTKKALYLCVDPIHAQIISLEQIGAQAEELKAFIKNVIPAEVRRKGL